MCCARSRLDVSCSVHFNVGQAASMVWKMVLFPSFRFSDPSPSRITHFGGNRCLCVPRSVLPIIRPRVRHSRKAWWISGGTAKGKAATLTGISVLSTYKGLHLLEDIRSSDVSFKPHQDLVTEMSRLQALEIQTVARWSASEDGNIS